MRTVPREKEAPPFISFTYNRVTLVARAASVPEVRFTPAGQRVATLNVATHRPSRAGATSTTDWHRVVCWEKLAEIAAEHVTKGQLLFIEGTLTYRTRQDQQRQKHTTTEILARELILLDRSSMSCAQPSVKRAPDGIHEDLQDAPR